MIEKTIVNNKSYIDDALLLLSGLFVTNSNWQMTLIVLATVLYITVLR